MTWLRKKKQYRRPRKLHDKIRMEEESRLIKIYGLKNKKEIWKADASIERLRNRAKKLITAEAEEQEKFFVKLKKMGFNVSTTADVLALNKEDWLKRRLQSVLMKKYNLNPKHTRQLIAHKHVKINNKVSNIPGYIVKTEEEDKIEINASAKLKPKTEKKEAEIGGEAGGNKKETVKKKEQDSVAVRDEKVSGGGEAGKENNLKAGKDKKEEIKSGSSEKN